MVFGFASGYSLSVWTQANEHATSNQPPNPRLHVGNDVRSCVHNADNGVNRRCLTFPLTARVTSVV